MKIIDLISEIPGDVNLIGDPEVEITALCADSRQVNQGSLFFCTPGLRVDAHTFAPEAVEKGAVALIVQRKLDIPVTQVVVEDVRLAQSYIASRFYDFPWKKMRMVGITGTKGKTTTSFLVKSILEANGDKVGLIGTVCSMIGDETIPANLTTPDPIVTQSLLYRMVESGCTAVVMEVSAHALAMHRLAGMVFDVAAFTNFSQDHLDFFGDMDTYFNAKLAFLTSHMAKNIVYNVDDERVSRASEFFTAPALRTGIRESSDVYANEIEIGESGCEFKLTWHKRFKERITLKLAGIFNVYNALLASGICICLRIAPETIKRGLESVKAVPGRAELLDINRPYRVILDYAHSPDSLENILTAVRQTAKKRMIVLFGCGGNRDSGKRSMMGRIAGTLADYCILTSDNPRYGNPMEILAQIEEGIHDTDCEYTVIENRRDAIRYALQMAKPGDVIILAGKGHETYQDICGVKYPFDEKKVVSQLLDEMRN